MTIDLLLRGAALAVVSPVVAVFVVVRTAAFIAAQGTARILEVAGVINEEEVPPWE